MIAHIVENMRTKLKLQFDTADLIGDLVGVPIYIILGQIVIVLGVLHKSDLVTHFFIKEEAQCISAASLLLEYISQSTFMMIGLLLITDDTLICI